MRIGSCITNVSDRLLRVRETQGFKHDDNAHRESKRLAAGLQELFVGEYGYLVAK
jgi:hypothetical protein